MEKAKIKKILILGVIVLTLMIIMEAITIYKKKTGPLCKNCNVLLISIDTLSAKHLPCYDYDKNTAPNLCQFGKDNVLFSNSYAQSYWTRPSQTSVLTGLHGTTHGLFVAFTNKLDKKYKTISELLKYYGYKTYYFGPKIDDFSWDESVIRGFDYMEPNYKNDSLDHWQKALDILEENKKSKTPTFMYLHTYYVHSPYAVGTTDTTFIDKSDRQKYPQVPLTKQDYLALTPDKKEFILYSLEERVKSSNTKESLDRNMEMLNKLKNAKTFEESVAAYKTFPEMEIESYAYTWYFATFERLRQKQYVASIYDEGIYQMDTELKNFLKRLEGKFAKDTIVIFYADHGEILGERGGYSHCEKTTDCLYMETVKVPLIIRIPGVKSKKIDELAQGIDIYPTILKAIGKEIPAYIEGEDLSDLMAGRTQKTKKSYIVSEAGRERAVLIDKKWSLYSKELINFDPKNMELYDLENDKNQLENVASKYPNVIAEKTDILKKYVEQRKKETTTESVFPDWIDEVKKEKITKEGYF